MNNDTDRQSAMTDEASAILARVAEIREIRGQTGVWITVNRVTDELCTQVERDQARIIELEAEVARLRAHENPCSQIFDHKWLDPECIGKGCQSLVFSSQQSAALKEKLIDKITSMKFPIWWGNGKLTYNVLQNRLKEDVISLVYDTFSTVRMTDTTTPSPQQAPEVAAPSVLNLDRAKAVVNKALCDWQDNPGEEGALPVFLEQRFAATLTAEREAGRLAGIDECFKICLTDTSTKLPDERRGYLTPGELKIAAQQAARLADKIRALAAKPLPQPLYRHKARGTVYTIVGKGRVQCPPDAPLRDDEEPLIYRDAHSGHYGIRREPEFFDGRFELLNPQPDRPERRTGKKPWHGRTPKPQRRADDAPQPEQGAKP